MGNSTAPPEKSSNELRFVYDRVRFILSRMIMSDLARTTSKTWIAQTVKELAVAGIALKRFELKHGRPAQTLEDLVPEFVATVPWDYMDGKALKYKMTKGRAVLYSAGDDRVDAGGDATPRTTKTNFNFQNGRDLVWPEPASAEEIEAYKNAW